MADAVMSQDVQQTAGTLKQTGDTETAKLGPVGVRGRIVLRYRCERLYSVKEMAVDSTAAGAGGLAEKARLDSSARSALLLESALQPRSTCCMVATAAGVGGAPSGREVEQPMKSGLCFLVTGRRAGRHVSRWPSLSVSPERERAAAVLS